MTAIELIYCIAFFVVLGLASIAIIQHEYNQSRHIDYLAKNVVGVKPTKNEDGYIFVDEEKLASNGDFVFVAEDEEQESEALFS